VKRPIQNVGFLFIEEIVSTDRCNLGCNPSTTLSRTGTKQLLPYLRHQVSLDEFVYVAS